MHFIKLSILFSFCIFFNALSNSVAGQARTEIALNAGWQSFAADSSNAVLNFENEDFNDSDWKKVDVPHNWDAYDGYRRLRHGNRHGTAWYRKTFSVSFARERSKRYFIFFEGVGSYAIVWLNGKKVGYHAGGRTSFTIDVTNALHFNGEKNILAVKADHPAFIKDLPWVCGGCSDERGFSEGSQPMGIFRPVHLIVANDVRVEPFGMHVWNDSTVSTKAAKLYLSTELKNYSNRKRSVHIVQTLLNHDKKAVVTSRRIVQLEANETLIVPQDLPAISNVHLWAPTNPYLYQLQTQILEDGKLIDLVNTDYGIRSIFWSSQHANKSNQFFINGKPFFINGIAEYEHMIGNSHAFDIGEINSRVMQLKAAGFNAFRDGHQPHNLRYDHYWDSCGILWWTQFSAHIWYDSPEFRSEFKTLLKEWVKERRNSPSIILWGLQNESKLPEDFARECTNIIRSMDPTASSQRLVTTCNGGAGTDWDVPQNWTGTYGGDPEKYAEDVKRQVLIGEYGAWRTIDLHSNGGYSQDSILSEDRMTALMETKVRLAEAVKDSAAGHFFWLYNSHDNPGRVQGGEGFRELDRIGPVNYKGLMTSWGEPVDAYYMYQANYTSGSTNPMLYIASHTWPGRWKTPGIKNGIIVYSNCDEVELFNDVENVSLGKRKRNGVGTHFQWDNIPVNYNVLYAVGYVKGKVAAKDVVLLHYLPEAPHLKQLVSTDSSITKPAAGYKYLYRVNCGGPDYKDAHGNIWMADRHKRAENTWGSLSWTDDFKEMPPFFASQRQTYDPVAGTPDWPLFQQFRYGRDKLQFSFPLANGAYRVELYFIEPWLGKAGGVNAKGWRLFDVAANDRTVLKNVDLWKEAGHDKAIKKMFDVTVTNGKLVMSFPHVEAGQAVISAIAIASKNKEAVVAEGSAMLVKQRSEIHDTYKTWLNNGQMQFADRNISFTYLPPFLYGAEWIQTSADKVHPINIVLNEETDVYIATMDAEANKSWLPGFDDTRAIIENTAAEKYAVFKKRFKKDEAVIIDNQASTGNKSFSIFFQHASHMQPAFDLKQSKSYKAAAARLKGAGLATTTIAEKQMVVYNRSNADTIEWQFETGVADIYSITIRYNNPFEKELKATLRLLAIDGTLLKTEEAIFTNTRPGKWNYINSSTGGMINAGTYKLQLISNDAAGLMINDVEIQ